MGLSTAEEREGLPAPMLRQMAIADEAHKKAYPEQYGTPRQEAPAAEGTPAAKELSTAPPNREEDTYKHKYEVLAGKFNKEIRERQAENSTILNQNKMLQDSLAELTAEVQKLKEAKPQPVSIDENEKNFKEQFDEVYTGVEAMVRRMFSDFEAKLDAKLGQATNSVRTEFVQDKAKTAYERYIDDLTKAHADWQEINVNPKFLEWLEVTERYAGKTRMELMREAHTRMDAPTVIAFFDDFLKEKGTPARREPTPHPNDRGSGSGSPSGGEKIYTGQDLTELSEKVRRGEMTEEDAAPLEQKIITSLRKQRGLVR
jgi:F0F1-type ATP synthase membrane subunit b/b'